MLGPLTLTDFRSEAFVDFGFLGFFFAFPIAVSLARSGFMLISNRFASSVPGTSSSISWEAAHSAARFAISACRAECCCRAFSSVPFREGRVRWFFIRECPGAI